MKLDTRSFGFRLWMYFVLFTALIFTLLWLLQTVFLQSFYNDMMISNTKNAAEQIIASASDQSIDDLIDSIARDNSLLVFITDENGKILYSSDAFKNLRGRDKSIGSLNENGNGEGFGNGNGGFADKKGDRHLYRSLPEHYDVFMESLRSGSSGTAEYNVDNYYAYGAYIDYYASDGTSVLYVGTDIEPVGASVRVISIQLVWVTVISVIAGFALSWFIARRFAYPVKKLSEKAKLLGEKDYDSRFKKSFCSELDELNDTLDKTNENLIESRNFQMELLANISHDLRTPLTMIKGYAEMVRDISREDEKQCAEDIAVIIKEADRLTALVNEIMEYSELKTAGSDALKVGGTGADDSASVTDLSAAVKKTADSFDALYRHQGYVIEQSIEPDIYINGSASRLERAVYNLIDNAVRHSGDNKRVCVSLARENGYAVIGVRDFGEGIPESEIEHIWDRYYTSRMRKGKGVSGLGLPIVKQIVELHGGECTVSTEKGKGTEFVVRLPMHNRKNPNK